MCKCPNSLSYISRFRRFKVKQDRQIIALAKFFSDGFENRLVLSEPTEYEYRFSRDSVNDTADFLVVKEQVDELGYFNIIYCKCRFTRFSND